MTTLALRGVVSAGPGVVIGRHLWSERRLDRAALARINKIMASR